MDTYENENIEPERSESTPTPESAWEPAPPVWSPEPQPDPVPEAHVSETASFDRPPQEAAPIQDAAAPDPAAVDQGPAPRQEPFSYYQAPTAPEPPHPGPEPQAGPAAQPDPYSSGYYQGAGVGRKESPFADSPYVMYHRSAYEPPVTPPPITPPPTRNDQPPREGRPRKKGRKVWKGVVAAVLVLALVGSSCGITAFALNSYWTEKTNNLTESFNQRFNALQEQLNHSGGSYVPGTTVSSEGLTPSQVYDMNYRSVVFVASQTAADRYGQIGVSSGSGFIFTENGYIVTNCHVVEGGSAFTVTTYDDEEYEAQLIGYDENNDVALLKIEAEGLPAVTIGDSDALSVGDMVTAIGNPLGTLTSTQTVGYVSAKDRSVTTDGSIINMIQTDAAINSGNSGGPLFNMYGEVVGITSAKYSGTTSSGASIEGISFAIPINDVLGMIEDLAEFGYIKGAYLGVTVRNMDSSVTQYGIPVGAYVDSVAPGYCAEKAGIQAGDVIIRLGGYDVGSITDLTRALRKYEAGDTVIVEVFRAGQTQQISVVLDERPADLQQPTQETAPTQPQDDSVLDDWIDRFFGGGGN